MTVHVRTINPRSYYRVVRGSAAAGAGAFIIEAPETGCRRKLDEDRFEAWRASLPFVPQVAEPGYSTAAQDAGAAGASPGKGSGARGPGSAARGPVVDTHQPEQCVTAAGAGDGVPASDDPAPAPDARGPAKQQSAKSVRAAAQRMGHIERRPQRLPRGRVADVAPEDNAVLGPKGRWIATRPVVRTIGALSGGRALDMDTLVDRAGWGSRKLFARAHPEWEAPLRQVGLELVSEAGGRALKLQPVGAPVNAAGERTVADLVLGQWRTGLLDTWTIARRVGLREAQVARIITVDQDRRYDAARRVGGAA